jgi:glycosyltransferase involved in cell wall biosynthesis
VSNDCRITFFGTYLSATSGSKTPSETIAVALSDHGYEVGLVSRHRAVPLRIVESFWQASAGSRDLVVLDVFSTRVLRLTAGVARILTWRKTPFIAVLHGGALLERYETVKPWLLPILEQSAKIITPSGFLRSGFEQHGFAVDCLPNPLALDHFPFRERSVPRSPIRLLWVRAFTEIYRPQWAVEVVKYLQEKGIESTLTMVGPDMGLLPATRSRAAELGVTDRIDYVGAVPNVDLHTYYQAHDYLLNTTQFESFGIALVEAASTGLPIISASVGEVSHSWTDDVDIFLVPGASSFEFAERIAGLRSTDPEGHRYKKISYRGREKVKEYALSGILPRWENLIESICHGGI